MIAAISGSVFPAATQRMHSSSRTLNALALSDEVDMRRALDSRRQSAGGLRRLRAASAWSTFGVDGPLPQLAEPPVDGARCKGTAVVAGSAVWSAPLEQPEQHHLRDRWRARARIELDAGAVDVEPHRRRREIQNDADLPVGLAGRHPAQTFKLACA
jgi:hypothetical protein